MPNLRAWLEDGPYALCMSSGFFGFFAHCGVLTVLEEEGLLPSQVAGSSAGALVTGAWAAGLEATALAEHLQALRREDFWDPRLGWGLLRGGRFRRQLEELLPVSEMHACRVPAAISVYDLGARKIRVLREGALAPAIHASCAVPGMFHPVRHAGGLLVDGGVADRPGIQGLAGVPRVLFHHLASRSPWRARDSEGLSIPRREGLVTLVIDPLPRSGPFKLERGREAFLAARRGTRTALAQPVVAEEVRVTP
ncbi:MAG: patatin-like phospholipase family protein [Sandaracinaceae bacterium]